MERSILDTSMPENDPAMTERWRQMLLGELPGLRRWKRVMGALPATPRCKLCLAPFGRPGSVLLRLIGNKPSPLNRRICTACIKHLHKGPGGAEIDVTALFVDVRGSTGIAEQTSPGDFGQLLARFYGTAARVVDRWDGIVDKFVGDEAVALFIPGFAGSDHPAKAIAAARDLMREMGHSTDDPWIPLGAGIHTGTSFVGTVGEGDAIDFTAVGDTVNTAARLMSTADFGEIVISAATAAAAGIDTAGLERRTFEVRGRQQPVEAWVDSSSRTAETAAV
jgi:adenylate cyclase